MAEQGNPEFWTDISGLKGSPRIDRSWILAWKLLEIEDISFYVFPAL
jgi:hypothetical protein